MDAVLAFTMKFVHVECYRCGCPIMLPEEFNKHRLNDHKSFWCPNGHEQAYHGESEAERLRKSLHAETLKRERAERERREAQEAEQRAVAAREALERKAKREKKRAAAGVCPCCPRTFVNLQRHLVTKHPDYAAENGVNIAAVIKPAKK